MTISAQGGFGGGVGLPPYLGPGDIFGAAYAFWGLRAYRAADIGVTPVLQLSRAAGFPQDKVFTCTPSGLVDIAAIAAFIAGTTITNIDILDQVHATLASPFSGNPFNGNLVGFTKPTFVPADSTSLPCLRFNGSQMMFASGSAINLPQPMTWAGVCRSDAPTASGRCVISTHHNGAGQVEVGASFTALDDIWSFAGGSVQVNSGHPAGALHDFVSAFNGASSHLYADAVNLTGNAGGNASSSPNCRADLGSFAGSRNWIGDWKETGMWPGVATAFNAASYHSQASQFWGYSGGIVPSEASGASEFIIVF